MALLKDRALAARDYLYRVVPVLVRRSPLGTAFLDDRFLAAATGILIALTIAPLLLTPILPFVDHGVNVGASGLLYRAAVNKGIVGFYYKVNRAPIPYWTTYFSTAAVSAVVGPLIAAKVLAFACSISVPLAVMRLLIALGRSPRLGLWAFVFAYDLNLQWGWASYLIGMSLALVAVAKVIEAKGYRDALWLIPFALLISLSHIHAVAVFGLLATLLIFTKEKPWRAVGIHAVAMSGMSLVIVPWFLRGLKRSEPGAGFSAEFPPVAEKIAKMYSHTLDTTAHPLGSSLTLWAFVAFVTGLLILAAVPGKDVPVRDRVRGVLIFLVLAGLYLALPFQVNTPFYHTFTYTRLASFVLLTALLVPCPDLSGRRVLSLAPGLIAALLMLRATSLQFSDFSTRVTPYLEIIDRMEPDKRFIPVDLEVNDPANRLSIYHMIHGYAAAAKQSYDPHLFDEPSNPLLFRKRRLPGLLFAKRHSFSTDDLGVYYDYIVVKGLRSDPVKVGKRPKGPVVELVHEAGDWRLYKVNNPIPY